MTDVDITEKLRGIGWADSVGFPPKEDLLKHAIAVCHEAANEIERLREKCNKQAMVLRHLIPEQHPSTLFIHAEIGERDQNNMPEKLLVVPSLGVDWSQVYVRTEKTEGPKW
jgi:hypothetical protein